MSKQQNSMKQHMGMKAASRISNTVVYIILVAMSVIWLIPFVCIVIQSFRINPTGMTRYLLVNPEAVLKPGLTIKFGFDNYVRLWNSDFPRWYLNTFIIALIVAVVQTVIVLCMSYTLSRFRFKLRKPMMQFMLILGMFPGMLSMIILYQVLKDLGLALENAVPGLILVYVASSGMGYYVSKGFFDTIPKSLDEAARVDGATRATVFFRITLPMAKPIVIYTLLTAFMGPWGDFMFAKYIVNNATDGMNVAVGLQNLIATSEGLAAHYTHFCAAGVLVAIPVTILFMCLQRYYVEGVTGGAVKG
jgi:arabinogalactan oligomer/maltooligosaccharide transport system permease protein